MPKIDVHLDDLRKLLGEEIDLEAFEERLAAVKGEYDGYDEEERVVRVDLNDTNRPDLWCTEGIARQLRVLAGGGHGPYEFFGRSESSLELQVDPDLDYRPYAGAIVARGVHVDEEVLRQLIQTQEKLAENFGHGRASVSIGVYNVDGIEFPIHYRAVDPGQRRFVPLGHEEEMSLDEILEQHEKGQAYGHLLAGCERLPILEDARGTILSFPPIINSRAVGEVESGSDNLLIETTATEQMAGLLVLAIFAANLADRGATIESVVSVYQKETPRGLRVVAPVAASPPLRVLPQDASRLLGVPVESSNLVEQLQRYGCDASHDGQEVLVSTPAYRDDYLHAVDAIEDYLIARGLDSLPHQMPRSFTAGNPAPEVICADRVRDLLIGFGFEETISNILTARANLIQGMGREGARVVEIANPYSETYSAVRDQILPFLLQVERESATALYPHRFFEVGEVAVLDPSADHGSRTEQRVAVLVAHDEANFSEIHAHLDHLLYYRSIEYELVPVTHPTYIDGRAGSIQVEGLSIGVVGEVHPRVLEYWDIKKPAVAFEFTLAV